MPTARTKRNTLRLGGVLRSFLQDSRSVGIVLLLCTAVSVVIANSASGRSYLRFINQRLRLPAWMHTPHTPLHWINDGAMALFFFLVGMEIKRELMTGELSDVKKASLPVAAALGGMLVPALLYLAFNHGGEFAGGWGIPMATDIAFSLGVASLLGPRVPVSLKIFLMALAIIDDLGAILVIALFYGGELHTGWLLGAVGLTAVLALLQVLKKHHLLVFIIIGIALWYMVYNSGVHATIAGVTAAFFVPPGKLEKYEHRLKHAVNFIVLPLFALVNTAIILPADLAAPFATPLSWGILAGLVLGKPLGIVSFCFIMVRLGLGKKPSGSSWMQITGVGVLAGIGFTMSIFITLLAFRGQAYRDISKLAIMTASLLSIIGGIVVLRLAARAKNV